MLVEMILILTCNPQKSNKEYTFYSKIHQNEFEIEIIYSANNSIVQNKDWAKKSYAWSMIPY